MAVGEVEMSEAETSSKTCASLAIVWPHLPGAECFAVWKTAISKLVDSAIPDDADIALFDFHGCTWQLPETFVQINGGSAITMSRSQHVIDDRPISQMSIYMLTGGSVVSDYDGLKQTQLPGDVVVVDYSVPYEASTPGYEGITLTFDRARAPLGLQGDVHGTMLSANSAAGKVIGAQMRTLIEHIDGLSIDQAQSASDGILQFAATAFRVRLDISSQLTHRNLDGFAGLVCFWALVSLTSMTDLGAERSHLDHGRNVGFQVKAKFA